MLHAVQVLAANPGVTVQELTKLLAAEWKQVGCWGLGHSLAIRLQWTPCTWVDGFFVGGASAAQSTPLSPPPTPGGAGVP